MILTRLGSGPKTLFNKFTTVTNNLVKIKKFSPQNRGEFSWHKTASEIVLFNASFEVGNQNKFYKTTFNTNFHIRIYFQMHSGISMVEDSGGRT